MIQHLLKMGKKRKRDGKGENLKWEAKEVYVGMLIRLTSGGVGSKSEIVQFSYKIRDIHKKGIF